MEKKTEKIENCQVRISKRLRDSIKVSAIKNKMGMEEMANLLISAGIGALKK